MRTAGRPPGHSRWLAVAGLVLLSVAWTTAGLAQEANRWDAADAAIVRLPPAAFGQLPEAIVHEMIRRRCTVPQPWELFISSPANVISGEFQKPGQIDWAVLCSVDRDSSLLIFWNGSADQVEQIGDAAADRGGLQVVRGEEIGYSIAIYPVDEAYILDHYNAYGGPEPPPIDHQGINYAFIEKASVVLYRYEGDEASDGPPARRETAFIWTCGEDSIAANRDRNWRIYGDDRSERLCCHFR